MTNYTFSLPKREETSKQWDTNQILEAAIAAALKASRSEFSVEEQAGKSCKLEAEPIKKAKNYANVDYGGKKLSEAGCAIFALDQGLRYRYGTELMPIEKLAEYVASKGYYKFGKGTYHNLFDHLGLRRATHVQELIDAVENGRMVTVLVKNDDYTPVQLKAGASHFVNLIGREEATFLVADSQIEEEDSVTVSMMEIFNATRVAWIW